MLPPNPTTAPHGGGVWREDLVLERIAGLVGGPKPAPGAPGWGDDAAVLAVGPLPLVWCVDAAVAGVHLDVARFPLADLGYRAAVAALSDLAAMGARPLGALLALCAPGETDVVAIERAAVDACAASDCRVLGGDLSRSAVTSVVVSALGEAPDAGVVARAGARPGDAVLVTGPLGGSAAGLRRRRAGAALDDPVVLRHRRPAARLAEGQAAAGAGTTSMLDVSDGLARDVRRLAVASGVGVELAAVPVADGATLDEALGGGEDYELVLTHPEPERLQLAFVAAGLAAPLRIGEVTRDPGRCTLDGASLPDVGWRHGGIGP